MKPDIGRESRFLPIPPAFDTLFSGASRIIAIAFGMEKLEWCGYPTVKKNGDMFNHFDRIHEHGDGEPDRQTDGWMDRHCMTT